MNLARRTLLAATLLLLLSIRASADTSGEELERQNPSPCMTSVAPLIVTWVLQRDIHGYLRLMGRGRKLSVGWAPGNPQYDRAFAIVLDAVRAEEGAHGPLATIDIHKFVAAGFNRADSKTRASLADYLKTPAGSYAWEYFVDDANCGGMLSAFDDDHTAFTETQRVTIRTVRQRLAQHRIEYNDGSHRFTKAQLDSVDRYATLIAKLLFVKSTPDNQWPTRFGIDDFILIRKLGADIAGTESKVIDLMNLYERQPAT